MGHTYLTKDYSFCISCRCINKYCKAFFAIVSTIFFRNYASSLHDIFEHILYDSIISYVNGAGLYSIISYVNGAGLYYKIWFLYILCFLHLYVIPMSRGRSMVLKGLSFLSEPPALWQCLESDHSIINSLNGWL